MAEEGCVAVGVLGYCVADDYVYCFCVVGGLANSLCISIRVPDSPISFSFTVRLKCDRYR